MIAKISDVKVGNIYKATKELYLVTKMHSNSADVLWQDGQCTNFELGRRFIEEDSLMTCCGTLKKGLTEFMRFIEDTKE